jgi:hypothetical protein
MCRRRRYSYYYLLNMGKEGGVKRLHMLSNFFAFGSDNDSMNMF